jgi:6-phosphogluconolactonase
VPWKALRIFFTDERAVPPAHELSNYRIAEETLLAKVPAAQVHRLRAEAADLDAEARRAAAELRDTLGTPPRFDLMLLGLGPDGHILSLFAGVPSSSQRGDDELVKHVAAPERVEPHVARLTLTPFLVVTARTVVLQVSGAKKAEVLARVLKGPEDLIGCPAQWIRKASGRVVVVCDAEAARRL